MKKTLITLIKIAILAFIVIWASFVVIDYFKITKNEKPLFCISEETKNYKDGTTYICNGLGYKGIRYDRSCIKSTMFGSFLLKERQCG